MKACVMLSCAAFAAGTALADTIRFDEEKSGVLPSGWVAGVTGPGEPQWSIRADASAPSRPHVLVQSGSGYFPWCVKKGVSIADGFVEVKFKPMAGDEDQAGGVVWRWKDGDNYYVARANALEDNVALYYTANGTRHTLKSVRAPVSSNAWHSLRVEYSGTRISVALDGRTYIELQDRHLPAAGAVGVWTKADSVTAFDDFSYAPAAAN